MTIIKKYTLLGLFTSVFCSCFDLNYSPGSGLGTVATVDDFKYKDEYRRSFGDTLLKLNPDMVVPDSLSHLASNYDFLNLQSFRFTKAPKEIYFIQWSGTGFIEVRMVYNYEKHEWLTDDESTRVKQRFETEILNNIDSLIELSTIVDDAKYKK
ncbi:MAG: hypothetical protein H6600_06760 [Flavobacteriales bacterium]|nr:hypothetical protein [Flavobacteriales bacterium]